MNVDTSTVTAASRQRWQHTMMANYATPPLVLVRGRNATVWDADGVEYIDLLAGIAVNILGHAHPAVTEAVSRQVALLGHTSNLAIHEPGLSLAERLLDLAGRPGRVFFCNSGAEANEAGIKIARRTGRIGLVALHGSFHGRTMGALSLTGQPGKQDPFRPLLPDAQLIAPGDTTALHAAVTPDTSAFWLEPVAGEGGVVPLPGGYLRTAEQVCLATGALLVLDEVQTGIARTGAMFAYQHEGIQPDLLLLAKGLGGGLPIGACIAFGAAADLLQPGQHGTTFGGNPIACAAAHAVLDTIAREDLISRAKTIGERIVAALVSVSGVHEVRGAGALRGVVLDAPVAAAVEALGRRLGVIVNATQPDVLRLAPPLTITDLELDTGLTALVAAIEEASHD